jgi:hypothetical protein
VSRAPRASGSARQLCRVVEVARKLGMLSPALVAAALRVPLEEARLLVAALKALGWVERVRGEEACPCSRCPLAKVCPYRLTGDQQRTTVYRVTRRALEACRRLEQGEETVEENPQADDKA